MAKPLDRACWFRDQGSIYGGDSIHLFNYSSYRRNKLYVHNSITLFTNNESSKEGTFDKCIGFDRSAHFNKMDPPAPPLVTWAPPTPRSTFNNLLPVTCFFRWVNIAGYLFMIFFAEESVSCAGVCLHYVVDDVVAVAVDIVVLVLVVVVAAVFVAAVVVGCCWLLLLVVVVVVVVAVVVVVVAVVVVAVVVVVVAAVVVVVVVVVVGGGGATLPRERTGEIPIVGFLLLASIDSVDR